MDRCVCWQDSRTLQVVCGWPEIRINEYLGSDAAVLRSLLERLAEAIRVEAQVGPSEGFWSVVWVYVVLWLSNLTVS